MPPGEGQEEEGHTAATAATAATGTTDTAATDPIEAPGLAEGRPQMPYDHGEGFIWP